MGNQQGTNVLIIYYILYIIYYILYIIYYILYKYYILYVNKVQVGSSETTREALL